MKKTAVFLFILIALVIVTSLTVYLSFYYAAKHRNESIGSHISQNHIVTNKPDISCCINQYSSFHN